MGIEFHERPGVYSSYEGSKVSGTTTGLKAVGIVAVNTVAELNKVFTVTSTEDAVEIFGTGTMANLVETTLENGAAYVACVAVGVSVTEESYEESSGEEELEAVTYQTFSTDGEVDYLSGLEALEDVENLSLIICDSYDIYVQQQVRDSVKSASSSRKERIAVLACEPDQTVADMTVQAKELNCERVVLVAGKYSSENAEAGILYAAAVAGVIAKESDPALPLTGVELSSVTALDSVFRDAELDLLLQAGVMPLEQASGIVTIVRGVTTATESAGVYDTTWRELSTILVVDNVIPELRNTLKTKFARSKNTAQTRSSIRTQVLLSLDNKLSREIIVEYGDISVEQSTEYPEICLVNFSFAVAHGLNQIWLNAFVEV